MFGGPSWRPNCGPPCRGDRPRPRPCCAWASTNGGSRRFPTPGPIAAGTHRSPFRPRHRAADLEMDQMADTDRYFQTLAVPGSLFYHPPRESRVASFDEQNPFKPSYTVAGPADRAGRPTGTAAASSTVWPRWIPRSFSMEAGCCHAVKRRCCKDLVAACRALPAARFQVVSNGRAGPRRRSRSRSAGRRYRQRAYLTRSTTPPCHHGEAPDQRRPGMPIEELTRQAKGRAAAGRGHRRHCLGSRARALRPGGRAVRSRACDVSHPNRPGPAPSKPTWVRRFAGSARVRPPSATRRRWTWSPIRASSGRPRWLDPRLGRHHAAGRFHPTGQDAEA